MGPPGDWTCLQLLLGRGRLSGSSSKFDEETHLQKRPERLGTFARSSSSKAKPETRHDASELWAPVVGRDSEGPPRSGRCVCGAPMLGRTWRSILRGGVCFQAAEPRPTGGSAP